jgi:hypothetical protein
MSDKMNCRSATSEEELWSNGMSTLGNAERSVFFFVLNVLFTFGAPVMLAIGPVYLSWALLVLIWSGGVLWSRRSLRPKRAKRDEIMVKWGHQPRHTTVRAYEIYFSAALSDIFVIILAFFAIVFPSPLTLTEPLPSVIERLLTTLQGITRWGIAFLALAFLIAAVVSARSTCKEIRNSESGSSSAKEYDTFLAARNGHVVIGHEFRRAIQIPISSAASKNAQVEPLPGEVVGHNVERWVGQEGPFVLNAENEPNQHVLVIGPAGSGKTETVKAMLLRYWLAKRIPSLILDWTGEYVPFVSSIGGIVWTLPTTFTINPMRLSGYSPTERVNELAESLTDMAGLTDLQASEVASVIEQAYTERGILQNDESSWKNPPPVWKDLISILDARYRSGYYDDKALGSVFWALRKLMRSNLRQVFADEPGEFLDTVLRIPTVIDLRGLKGQEATKSLVADVIFRRLAEAFETLDISRLRLFVVVEEAHTVLKTKEKRIHTIREPLLIRLVRMGRKYGFSIVLCTQLATDVPTEAAANFATIFAFKFIHPEQLLYVKKWVSLSRSEMEIYARLPIGAAFVARQSRRYPSLIKVQRVNDDEIRASKTISSQIQLPKPVEISRIRIPSKVKPESRPYSTQVTSGEKPTQTPESLTSLQLSFYEHKILRALGHGPLTIKSLLEKFSELGYREFLSTLHNLETEGLVQTERVPNLEGSSSVFYAALRAEWLQSESLSHRAMLNMVDEGLLQLRPVRPRAHPNAPDLLLEKSPHRCCIEIETGRKKLTLAELDEWAKHVRERDRELGYERVVVVVPNVGVLRRYTEACAKHGLEVVTIANVLAYFGISATEARLWKLLEKGSEEV